VNLAARRENGEDFAAVLAYPDFIMALPPTAPDNQAGEAKSSPAKYS
jgi:hypothetical protein